MTAPISAARTGGLSFRLLGIPVTIHVTFLVIMGLLGLGLEDPARILVWIGVALLSVLLHELGHAVVGRWFGLHPKIDLAGMGGLTTWSEGSGGDRAELSRVRSVIVSASGPGIGIIAGLLVLAAGTPCCNPSRADTLLEFALTTWVYVSFAWGALNLLPILPLDGGHIAEALMPGPPMTRRLRAAMLSIGTATGAAVVAVYAGLVFAALFLGFFAWNNIRVASLIRAQSSTSARLQRQAADHARKGDLVRALELAEEAARSGGPAIVRAQAASLVVHLLIDGGRPVDALSMAADPRPGLALSESAIGRALAANDQTPAAQALFEHVCESPDDQRVRGILAMRHAFLGNFTAAEDVLADGPVRAGVAETIRALRPN